MDLGLWTRAKKNNLATEVDFRRRSLVSSAVSNTIARIVKNGSQTILSLEARIRYPIRCIYPLHEKN